MGRNQNTLVVDLHIEKIARGYRNFAPADSLRYQIDLFERIIQQNRSHKGMKIDFVHGSGTGTLRAELIKILHLKYAGFAYEDAPFSQYGYQGAIRVTIK